MQRVAMLITVFRKPERLEYLLENMNWAGWPDIPCYVVEDRSPYPDAADVHEEYARVCKQESKISNLFLTPQWGCMQGSIDFGFQMLHNEYDWIIYIPDDVLFSANGLWNELSGVYTYGRRWVGGIQAPYWNAEELERIIGVSRSDMFSNNWRPIVPYNKHWDNGGRPRKYINLNGAGFSLNTDLYRVMGSWPKCTWRLDEYAGYMAWQKGFACITLPGPPRIHYFGGTTQLVPDGMVYHKEESWQQATGFTPFEAGARSRAVMNTIPEISGEVDGTFNDLLNHFEKDVR